MNNEYQKIKADLLDFGKRGGACVGAYQRLYKSESIEEVIAVVKHNFRWCAKYRSFADVIIANREQFAEHQIWVNQDVRIQEGIGYLFATEGEIRVDSYGTSTINIESCGTSTVNVGSCGHSTINVESYVTSTINVESYGHSTINVESYDTSTINVESYDTSTIRAEGHNGSTINVESYDTSTINVESYGHSTINAKGRNYSTMIFKTSIERYEVSGHALIRLLHENRIVVADDSMKVEIQKK